jgi:long-chain fatty acid transport protein
MLDAQWTGWSTIQDLTFVRADGSVLQSTPEHFEDSWKLSIGANYRLDSAWTLRGGLAFDETPVQMSYRTARLPDNDRTWLTAGGQYRFGRGMAVDFGAAYIWVAGANIDDSGHPANAAAYGRLAGKYSSNTVIFSGQFSMEF